jgi:hypothetical protein
MQICRDGNDNDASEREREIFLGNKKKEERKKEKKYRHRMTPTNWSVVRYVVHGVVGKCMEEKKWIDVMYYVNK